MDSTEDTKSVRPSKKQRELLTYIEQFIGEHGYSPSYREIMAGCNYTSVATVSLHVNGLIKRGHLRKRDHSARSIEVVEGKDDSVSTNQVAPNEEKWLVGKVDYFFQAAEQSGQNSEEAIQQLHTLIASLKILGLEAAASSFAERLTALRASITDDPQQA